MSASKLGEGANKIEGVARNARKVVGNLARVNNNSHYLNFQLRHVSNELFNHDRLFRIEFVGTPYMASVTAEASPNCKVPTNLVVETEIET
jgi:hypothetical protein